MDDLAQLFPVPVEVPTSIGAVAVLPVRGRQLGRFAQVCAPLVERYQALRLIDANSGLDRLPLQHWRALIDEHADEVIEALAVAVERPAAEIGALFIDELLQLAATVVRVNANFFVERLLPTMMAIRADLMAGPTPSTASTGPDTPTPASTP